MIARLGLTPARSQPPLTLPAKFVDKLARRTPSRASRNKRVVGSERLADGGFLGHGFARKAFLEALPVGGVADRQPWKPLSLDEALAQERAQIDAKRMESARLATEEAAELDAEHLSPDRLAEHLPPELGTFLDRMPLPRRREREAAILRKIGWRDVGLIGLDPAMLAQRAESEAARYAKAFPCRDENGSAINMEPEQRKRRTEAWWRKRLRRDQSRALLYVEAAVGAVGGPAVPGRPLYVSDYAAALHRQHEERTQEILSDLWLVREDDPSVKISMLDVDRKSRARKAAERRMLIDMMLHRWKALGWVVCWITITLPGEYVPHSTNEGHRVTEWDPDLGPLEAMAAIQDDFHRVMALLRERRIRPQGWWNSQPQQSGTPHRHIVLAVPSVADARAVCDAFRDRFSTRAEGEDGPDRGCRAYVIGDADSAYAPPDGRNGSPETAASVARYAARYSTRYEAPKGDDEGTSGAVGGDEQARFSDWKKRRRARGHTWLGLDAQRSPVDLWRTLWTHAMRSEDYEPDDVRMALAMRHMRSTQAFIEIAAESRAALDMQTMKRAQQDAAREAWHAAIAVGMWPDADLDPIELNWLQGETAKRSKWVDVADPLPPVPLREERESVYGEKRKVFLGAVGVAERFRLSGRPTRAELCEAAEAIGVNIERPKAKLRRRHVLESIEAAGCPVTWRERKLTLAQLVDLAERLGVTIDVPTVPPRAGATVKAMKGTGFRFSRRPDGSLVGFDLSGEILLRSEHRWVIADTATAEAMAEEAGTPAWHAQRMRLEEARISKPVAVLDSRNGEGRAWAYLSDSPNDPRIGAAPLPGGEGQAADPPPDTPSSLADHPKDSIIAPARPPEGTSHAP